MDKKLIADWHNRLEECQYAGEILLEESTIAELAKEIKCAWRINKITRTEFEIAILILAINIAYYFYDDTGFWTHFINITKLNDMGTERIGQIVERRLTSYGLIKKIRTGPFRYVGTILEQTGISKKYIASFGRFIRQLKNEVGWDKFINLSYNQYFNFVDSFYGSKYLKNYLYDKDGWEFVVQCVKFLIMFENGTVDLNELRELKGYQPGFWDELLSEVQPNRNVTQRSSTLLYVKPLIIFDPSNKSIAIKFPDKRFIEDVDQPGKYTYPITYLTDLELFLTEYTGKVNINHKIFRWHIKGWMPDNKPAFFNLHSGLVDNDGVITPGHYYAVVPQNYKINQEIVLHEFGTLNIPTVTNYLGYFIDVKGGDFILPEDNLGKVTESAYLKWSDPNLNKLEYCIDFFDTYVHTLPNIEIYNFNLVEQGIFGIFYDIGSGIKRIKYTEELSSLKSYLELNAPLKGRIWLEVLGRNKLYGIGIMVSELRFCILPTLILTLRKALFGIDEIVEPIFKCDSKKLKIEWANVIKDNSDSKEDVKVGPTSLDGEISCDSFYVSIKIPFYRAGLMSKNGKLVRILTVLSLSKHIDYILMGKPLADVKLKLSNSTITHEIGIFDDNGKFNLNSEILKSSVDLPNTLLAELCLEDNGESIPLGTDIFNEEVAIKEIIQGNVYNIPQHACQGLGKAINLCGEIVSNPITNLRFNMMPKFNSKIDSFLGNLLACAVVFDNTHVVINNKAVSWNELVQSEELKDILSLYMQMKGDNPLPSVIEDILSVKRWKDIYFNKTKLLTQQGRSASFEEWKFDINSGRPSFRSSLSGKVGGQKLTMAWRDYLNRRYEHALSRLNGLYSDMQLVTDLGSLLKLLCLMRQARFSFIFNNNDHIQTFELKALYEQFLNMVKIINGHDIEVTEIDLAVVLCIQLTDEDSRLLSNFSLLNQDIDEYEERMKYDWLAMYILFKYLQNRQDGEYKKIADKLQNMISMIPISPEKGLILKTISGGK